MSDYEVLSAVTSTLKGLLEAHLPSGLTIDLGSPKDIHKAKKTAISLWLYRVIRDPDMVNRPPTALLADRQSRPSISVNLSYLVCPILDNPLEEQHQLGRIIQTFNDHAHLQGADLTGTLAGSDTELHVMLESLSLEDLTRVWDAISEPYQLSLSYLVKVVTIDSAHEPLPASLVTVRDTEYAQILSSR